MRLEEELKAARCKIEPEAFRQLIRMAYAEMYGEMPDEQLYFMPDESKRFAGVIKQRARSPRLADSVILRTLSNLRKRSALKSTGS